MGAGQRTQSRVGTLVRDKYRIDAFLATGSMANVYSATHRNGSRVALKILHRELASDPALAERFKREGYFANTIGHPGVIRAIDDDVTEDGCAFLVMELLEGENLEERRKRMHTGRLGLGEVLTIADAMLDVLAAAHAKDILHRDMKPENVFLTKDNQVKLLDFGVARFNDGKSTSDMTGVGMVLGTPAFMPPEQALGKREDVDARSDIWGVGATLFTVLTGEAVHAGGDAKTKLIATARTPARPIRDVVPEIPRAVASVIDRALSFERKDRWEDAHAMREALRWARMSLENDPTASLDLDRPTIEPKLAAPVTRRQTDDEPTVARHSPIADDVFTSAPPITLRDLPPSMAQSNDPVFSLRNDPVFSLRQKHGEDDPGPETERMAKNVIGAIRVKKIVAPKTETPLEGVATPEVPKKPSTPPESIDVPMSFTKPLMQAPVFPPPDAFPVRPAAGEPPPPREQSETKPALTPEDILAKLPHAALSPSKSTLPGFPPPSLASQPLDGSSPSPAEQKEPTLAMRATAPLDQPAALAMATTAAMPAQAPPQPQPNAPPPNGPHFPDPSNPPPPQFYPSGPPAPEPSGAPPPYLSSPPEYLSHPPSSGGPVQSSPSPGPLLGTIVPKQRGSRFFRVFVPVTIGIVAGIATYVLVLRHRNANALQTNVTQTASASAAPSSSIATSAAPSASDAPIAHDAPSPPPTTAANPAPSVSVAAAAPTEKPPKKRRRPRPPASSASAAAAAAAATTTATATATAAAEPEDPPEPATPTATPTSTALPNKEPDPGF